MNKKKKKSAKKKVVLTQKQEDIETTKRVVRELCNVALFTTDAVKRGWKLSHMFRAIDMISGVVATAREAKEELLPELKDLDQQEAEELAGLIYEVVRSIYITAKKEV